MYRKFYVNAVGNFGNLEHIVINFCTQFDEQMLKETDSTKVTIYRL